MSASLGGIATSIDLRGGLLEVRDQGARGSCLACASSDAHAHSHGLSHELSVEHLFYCGIQKMPGKLLDGGLTFDAADSALKEDGQARETEWPYEVIQPNPWVPPTMTDRWFAELGSVDSKTGAIASALASGRPVVLGLELTTGFHTVQDPPHIISAVGSVIGGHAVLAVGMGRSPSGSSDDLILIRNSWGSGWGVAGHAWLSTEYLTDKLIGLRAVQPISSAS